MKAKKMIHITGASNELANALNSCLYNYTQFRGNDDITISMIDSISEFDCGLKIYKETYFYSLVAKIPYKECTKIEVLEVLEKEGDEKCKNMK